MFLVGDQSDAREGRIRAFLATEPPIAVILGAVHVEWTIRRAVLALSRTPNVELRARLVACHGLDQYKDLWKAEVASSGVGPPLPTVIRRWAELRRAFLARHRLVHGASSCGSAYAASKVETLIAAAADVRTYCGGQGIDLHARLPVRRRTHR